MSKNNKFKEILLSVKRSKFRCDDPRADEKNNEYLNIRPTILERDDFKCTFCDFRSLKWQEVHHIDDNHANNDPANLITTCPLCHACHHVGLAGLEGKGSLIYLEPELGFTQAELNQLMRVLWIGERSKNKELSMACIGIQSRIYKQSVVARNVIGTTEANVLGDFLLNLDEEKYLLRQEKLKGLFLYPFKQHYIKQIAYWEAEIFSHISDSWDVIAKQKLSRWVENKTGEKSDRDLANFLRDYIA